MWWDVFWVLLPIALIPFCLYYRDVVKVRERVLAYAGMQYSWKSMNEEEIAKLRRGLWNYGERLSTRWNYLVLRLEDNAREAVEGAPNPEVVSDLNNFLEGIRGYEKVPLLFAQEKVTRNEVLSTTLKRYNSMTKAARGASNFGMLKELREHLVNWIGDAEEFRDSVGSFNLPPDPNFGRVLER